MGKKFTTRRRVEFRDTDMARIVHFSVFFTYMEEAEHEFLRHLGLGVICDVEGQSISWPRVNAQCDYRAAIRFEEEIDMEVTVARIGAKSITYRHRMFRGETLVAEGSITTVCCKFEPPEVGIGNKMTRPESIQVPAKVVELLTPYLSE